MAFFLCGPVCIRVCVCVFVCVFSNKRIFLLFFFHCFYYHVELFFYVCLYVC